MQLIKVEYNLSNANKTGKNNSPYPNSLLKFKFGVCPWIQKLS